MTSVGGASTAITDVSSVSEMLVQLEDVSLATAVDSGYATGDPSSSSCASSSVATWNSHENAKKGLGRPSPPRPHSPSKSTQSTPSSGRNSVQSKASHHQLLVPETGGRDQSKRRASFH